MVGIEDDLERIGVVQTRIAPTVGDQDPVRLAVITDDAHENGSVGVNDLDHRIFRGRCSLDRLSLDEIRDWGRQFPDGIVDKPVDCRRLFDEGRASDPDAFFLGP